MHPFNSPNHRTDGYSEQTLTACGTHTHTHTLSLTHSQRAERATGQSVCVSIYIMANNTETVPCHGPCICIRRPASGYGLVWQPRPDYIWPFCTREKKPPLHTMKTLRNGRFPSCVIISALTSRRSIYLE